MDEVSGSVNLFKLWHYFSINSFGIDKQENELTNFSWHQHK